MAGPRSLRRTATWIAAAVVVVSVVGGGWYGLVQPVVPSGDTDAGSIDSPQPDPHETFPTPFRNARPGVRYVGDAACAACHPVIAETFHAHPMGRSAALVGRATPVERYDPAAKNPFTASGFAFRVEKIDDRVTHRVSAATTGGKPLPDYAATIAVAIGSGTRGRTYLSVEGGAVWQSPVSWFTKDGRWDLSPVHDLLEGGRRPITPDCLFCHTDRVEPVPGAENRFREPLFPTQVSIGCERCHGPGDLHVADRLSGLEAAGVDYAIVNPKHLPADLRTDICRQCHLLGVERVARRGRALLDYRPGLPWDQFVTTLVLRPDVSEYRKSVGQFEQMEASRCFTGGGGRLNCLSCHDPHAKPEPAAADGFYRGRCLTCHESSGCSAPGPERLARDDSCIACHMPRVDSRTAAHAAITDHRIRRRPEAEPPPPGRPAAAAPVVAYPPGPHAPPAAERERDWAVGAGRMAVTNPAARALGRPAAEQLTAAVARWPDDSAAWAALASVRGVAGDMPGAMEATLAAVAAAPESELALSRLALAATQVNDLDAALRAAGRLVEMNPTAVDHRLTRATVHLCRRDWASADADARAVLAIQPLHGKARLFQAVCRHHLGDPAGARNEAAVATDLIPSESIRAAYLRWFREQTR